jgi:lysophospholipase L1-like esterase
VTARFNRTLRLAALAIGIVALFAVVPRAVERLQPGLRIAAQIQVARVYAALGTDVVLLMGDSRVANLGHRTLDRPNTRIFNLGLAGLRAHEYRAFVERWTVPSRGLAVIWLGVNDIWYDDARAVAVATDVRQIVATLAAQGNRVILLDQIQADARAGAPHARISREGRAVNALIESTPPQAHVLHVSDMFEISVETGSAPRLYDGIHLTADGNEQVWQRIANEIHTQLTIRKP